MALYRSYLIVDDLNGAAVVGTQTVASADGTSAFRAPKSSRYDVTKQGVERKEVAAAHYTEAGSTCAAP